MYKNRFTCIPLYVLNVKLTKGIWNRVNFFNLCLYKNKTEEKRQTKRKNDSRNNTHTHSYPGLIFSHSYNKSSSQKMKFTFSIITRIQEILVCVWELREMFTNKFYNCLKQIRKAAVATTSYEVVRHAQDTLRKYSPETRMDWITG